MTEQMPDALFVDAYESRPNHRKYLAGEVEAQGDTKYLKASHVEATTVPKAKVDYLISLILADIFGQFNNVPELREDFEEAVEYVTGNSEIKPTVPRDKVEALIEKYQILLSAAKEYWEYEHDGDPFAEDARAMGEMTLDEIKPRSGENEFEQVIRLLEDKA